MSTSTRQKKEAAPAEKRTRRVSKKDQIIALYTSGIGDVEDLAMITGSRPSYIAGVLQESNLMTGYFDLYTTSAHPMNVYSKFFAVYSKFFARKLGFKDEQTASASIELIDRLHSQFELAGDRAGQHHALVMALTMFDRARWTGKGEEADLFRHWLLARLNESALKEEEPIDEEAEE